MTDAYSEEADAIGWPVREERVTDDPAFRHRPPVAAVIGYAPVVAHHEPHALGDTDRSAEGAVRFLRRAWVDVIVSLSPAVADDVSVLVLDHVSGAGDDPLDEGLA